MRGKTNINLSNSASSTGGIVNGNISEYQVIETNGIEIGDYVQFASVESSYQSIELIDYEDFYYNEHCYVSPFYKLSDNKYVCFTLIYSSQEYYLKAITFSKNDIGLEKSNIQDIKLSDIRDKENYRVGITSYKSGSTKKIRYLELSENNFIIMIWSGSSVSIVKSSYSDGQFYFNKLGMVSVDSSDYIENAGKFAFLNDSIIIHNYLVFFATKNNLLSVKINDESIEVISNVEVESSNNINSILNISDGKVAYVTYNKVFMYSFVNGILSLDFTCNINSDANPTLIKSYAKLSNNKFLSLEKNEETLKCFIYEIKDNAINYSTKIFNCKSGYTNYTILDNRILLFRVTKESSTKVSLSYSELLYDLRNDELYMKEYINIVSFNNLTNSTSSSYTLHDEILKLTDNNFLIRTLVYSVSTTGSTTRKNIRIYATNVNTVQDNLLVYDDTPQIVKYKNSINGVAKTSGSYGDIIEVYTPYDDET